MKGGLKNNNMKFNLGNKVLVLSMLGLFCLAMLPLASAFTETYCEGVGCVDNLGEIAMRITASSLIIEYPALSSVNTTTHGLLSATSYPFSMEYETATGKVSLIVGGSEVTFTTTEQLGFQTANLILNSVGGGGSISMSNLKLNNVSVSDTAITGSGQLQGYDYANIIADNGGFLFEGNLIMDFTGTTKISFNMWESIVVEELADLEILANEVSSWNFSIVDDTPTTTLGGLSVLVTETERRSLSFGNSLVWEKITSFNVENYNIITWLSRDLPDFENIVLGNLYQTTEEFTLNGVLGIWETYEVSDLINSGFKSSSVGISNFQILPSGSELDVYLLVL